MENRGKSSYFVYERKGGRRSGEMKGTDVNRHEENPLCILNIRTGGTERQETDRKKAINKCVSKRCGAGKETKRSNI